MMEMEIARKELKWLSNLWQDIAFKWHNDRESKALRRFIDYDRDTSQRITDLQKDV